MFQKACDLIYPCLCNVGGFSPPDNGRMFGMGCLIGTNLAITAKHVDDAGIRECGHAAVCTSAGLWASRTIFESEERDIALLKMENRVGDGKEGKALPNSFPGLGGVRFTYGLSVGYFGHLHRKDRFGKNTLHTCFAAASLSFLTRDVLRWALSAGFAEEGFSGSPVFSREGLLVGVLTEIMRIAQPGEVKMPQLVTVPLISPFKREIVLEISKLTGATLKESH
jgi:hypothetical protein